MKLKIELRIFLINIKMKIQIDFHITEIKIINYKVLSNIILI